jgi:hypothetical protein
VSTLKNKFRKIHLFWIIPVSLIAVLLIIILVNFTISAVQAYNERTRSEKIYSVGETIDVGPLSFKVSNISEKEISLTVPAEKIKYYGDLQTREDCDKYPSYPYSEVIRSGNMFDVDEVEFEKTTHARNYCNWRNETRDAAAIYLKDYQRVFVDYELSAQSTVDTKLIQIEVTPDSGRDVKKTGEKFDYSALLSEKFVPGFDFQHQSYVAKDIGGSMNKGITRSSQVNLDVKNDEKTVDFKLSYDGRTRIVRITR